MGPASKLGPGRWRMRTSPYVFVLLNLDMFGLPVGRSHRQAVFEVLRHGGDLAGRRGARRCDSGNNDGWLFGFRLEGTLDNRIARLHPS